MATRKSLLMALGTLILGTSLTMPALHGTSATNLHTNHVTFSGPVGLPGITLPGGTYVFERVVASNPDVIVVRSLDRTKVYFMASTQRSLRPSWLASDKTVILGESRPGTAPPISAWYPVGEEVGHAFVYKSR